MLIGDKRNFGVENCTHDIIVHQDDDDFYFPDSILAKIRILKQYPKCGCVFSNDLAAYNVVNNLSYMMDPEIKESCLSLPEATLMYKKSFWKVQKFPSTQYAEGSDFAKGREKKFVSIPCIFNMISLTHGDNLTGLTRHVELNDTTQSNNISNFYNLMDQITQNIIKKIARQSLINTQPNKYNNVYFKNYTANSSEYHVENLGEELNLLLNLENYQSLDIENIPENLSNDDLILICYYSGNDLFNLFPKNQKDIISPEIINILQHPRAKLMLYCSWECRNLLAPENKNNFYKFHQKYLNNIPSEKIILATSDFLNPIVHSFNPQIFGYDFSYLYAKMTLTKYQPLENKNPTIPICFLSRRGNIERTAIALFLYTFFKDKSLFSYLTVDSYSDSEINKFGVPVTQYKKFKKSLPIQIDYDESHDDQNFEKLNVLSKDHKTLSVCWHTFNQHLLEQINNCYVMLCCETNAEGPLSLSQQVSEKTYKPIALGMPFIIFTSKPGITKHLKSIGFKTFHPHINEEYDYTILPERTNTPEKLLHEYIVRFRKLLKEINRICSMNHQQLQELKHKCHDIVVHNQSILRNQTLIKPLPIIEK